MQISPFSFLGTFSSGASSGAGAGANLKAGADSSDAIVAAFRKEANKSPIERIREKVMKDMGVTADDLKKLPPDKLKDIEKAIDDAVARIVKERASAKSGQLYNVTA